MAMGGLIKKFATVGGATMASRVLGLAREALMAAALAAGPVADVFYTCFRFPNLFRRLFAEGAFNIAFVPLFAKELENGGEEAAQKFGQQVFSVLASWLIVFTVLALVFMPYLVATIVAPARASTRLGIGLGCACLGLFATGFFGDGRAPTGHAVFAQLALNDTFRKAAVDPHGACLADRRRVADKPADWHDHRHHHGWCKCVA